MTRPRRVAVYGVPVIRPAYLVAPALGVAGMLLILSGCISGVGTPQGTASSSSFSAASSPGAASGSARASGPASTSSSAAASASRSAAPRPAPPAVPAVKGYTAAAPAAGVAAGVEKVFDASPTVFGDPAIRAVKRGQTTIGTLALARLAPAYVGSDTAERGLVDGLVKGFGGAGYSLGSTALHGRRVVVATAKGSTILAWYDKGTVALFLSAEPKDVPVAFADAFLASQS